MVDDSPILVADSRWDLSLPIPDLELWSDHERRVVADEGAGSATLRKLAGEVVAKGDGPCGCNAHAIQNMWLPGTGAATAAPSPGEGSSTGQSSPRRVLDCGRMLTCPWLVMESAKRPHSPVGEGTAGTDAERDG